jgi:protein-S-isoprenylcysteine O-methyltransferase Ste14
MDHPRGGNLVIGRVAYGAFFTVVVAVGLWLWARALEPSFPVAPVHLPAAGAAVGGAGVALVIAGIREIVIKGGGLPMNAFPPPRLVRSGVYRWVANPIYLGFVLLAAGWAVATGSGAGLWLVTPLSRSR